jgi:hypothetical protein
MVREGIEIDYCPQCRGVWLDRGELDKIIEREAGLISGAPQTRPQPPAQTRPPGYHEPPPPGYYDQNYSRRRDHDDDDDDDHGKHYGRRKKRGLFGELFDFG